jgi:hypothetical protein
VARRDARILAEIQRVARQGAVHAGRRIPGALGQSPARRRGQSGHAQITIRHEGEDRYESGKPGADWHLVTNVAARHAKELANNKPKS